MGVTSSVFTNLFKGEEKEIAVCMKTFMKFSLEWEKMVSPDIFIAGDSF